MVIAYWSNGRDVWVHSTASGSMPANMLFYALFNKFVFCTKNWQGQGSIPAAVAWMSNGEPTELSSVLPDMRTLLQFKHTFFRLNIRLLVFSPAHTL